MALSGSTSLKISNTSSTPNEYLVLSWVVNSQSIANNTSNITVTMKAYSTYGSGAQPWNLVGNTVRLTVGGSQKVNNTNASIDFRGTSASNQITLATWTGNVSHNSDGSLSLSISGYMNYADTETSHSGLPGAHTISTTANITAIARASQPTCPSTGTFGSAIKITTNRASSSFTHTLVFSLGSHSETKTNVGSDYTFTIPASWAPSSAVSATLTVTCTTYNGSNNLGSKTCSSTISVPSAWVPSVTINYTKNNEADNGDILAKVTTINLSVSATAGTGATISSYVWSGAVSGSGTTKTHTPTNAQEYSYTVRVTDSRGRYTDKTLKLTAISAASSFSKDKTSMNFGDTIALTITKKKASFRHDISYAIGDTSIASSSDKDTSEEKTIPTSSASAVPNASSATMTITVSTKNGSTVVGTSSQTVQINVPTSWLPTFTSITDTGVDKFGNLYLQNVSKVRIDVNGAQPSLGATIVRYDIKGQNLNYSGTDNNATSDILNSFGEKEYTALVVDSRGRTAEGSLTITVTSYSFPTFTMTGHRCNSDGTANDFGEYLIMHYDGTWSDVTGNSWNVTLKYRHYATSDAYTTLETIAGQTGRIDTDSGVFSASVDFSWEIVAVLSDAVGASSVTYTVNLSTGRVPMDIYKDRLVAFHRTASADFLNNIGNPDLASVFDGQSWFEGSLNSRYDGKNSFPVYILPEVQKNTDLGGASTTAEYYQKLLKWICEKYPNVEHGVWKGLASPSSVDDISIHIYDTSAVDSNGTPQYASVLVTRYNGETMAYGYNNYVWYERMFGSAAVRIDATVLASTASAPISIPSGGYTIGGQTFPAYAKGWMITSDEGDASIYATDVNGFVYTAYRNNGTWQNGCRHSKINSATSTTSFKDAAGVTSAQTAAGVADIVHASYSTYANKFSVVTSGAVWGVLCMGASATYHSMIIFTYNEAKVWKCDYRNGTYIFCSIDTGAF